EPLVTAGRKPEPRVIERNDGVAGVAGTEVTVLVVAGRRGNVQLPSARGERAVWRDHDGGVEADRLGRILVDLVERRVYVRLCLGRQLCRELMGPSAGKRFRFHADGARAVLGDREVRIQRQLL